MTLNLTLDQALEKASPALRAKMLHGVELLRKSEKLALKYDPDGGFVCAMSFGKDSQAVYHLAQLAGVKMTPWFSPTTVDPAAVLRFGKQYYPEVKWLRPAKSIYQQGFDLKALPLRISRFCCVLYKDSKFPNKAVLLGVRRQESDRRARRKEVEVSGKKFSGSIDEFEQYQIERLKKKYKNLPADSLENAKTDTQIRCIGGKDQIMIMPILEWSDKDVWEFLNDVLQVPHCELYDQGRHRIGCIMCPFAQCRTMIADAKEHPHVYWRWVGVVRAIRSNYDGLFTDNQTSTPPPPPSKNIIYHGLRNGEKPFGMINPFGQPITDPAEMMVHWWMSKLTYADWYNKYFNNPTFLTD